MTERLRDWCIGGAVVFAALGCVFTATANGTASDARDQARKAREASAETARQQLLDRKDRQAQRRAMIMVAQAMDPEHAKSYEKILDPNRE